MLYCKALFFSQSYVDVKLKAVADSPLEDNVEPEEVAVEADLVNCVCGITETNGLMIQVNMRCD